MLTFLWRQLSHGRGRTVSLGSAVLVSALAFVLVAAAANTSELRTRGSVRSAFRPAYDILVRPGGSLTELERQRGLVRDNYLGGLFGGISLDQYRQIKDISRVEVAAPIANLGYVLPAVLAPIPLDRLLRDDAVQLYRLRFSFVANSGLSRFPWNVGYTYYTRRNPFERDQQGIVEVLPNGRTLPVCDNREWLRLNLDRPFEGYSYIECFSALSPGQGTDRNDPRHPVGKVGAILSVHFPILVAAIDPVEEARLLHLDETIVSGRYLRPNEASQLIRSTRGGELFRRYAPVIASTKTYVDERAVVSIERLRLRAPGAVPRILASPEAPHLVSRLPGTLVERRLLEPADTYELTLQRGSPGTSYYWKGIDFPNYWVPSDVQYRRAESDRLKPILVRNSLEIWRNPQYASFGYYPAPPSNGDTQFRKLTPYVGTNKLGGSPDHRQVHQRPLLAVVGRYDPTKLPGFNPLSRVPLETYYPPLLEPADSASKRALRGKPLRPTQNLGDYVQQPPLLLTTLEAIEPFLEPSAFEGPSDRAKKPISAIRIRVSGVKGPDELSMARIRAVALAIRDRTGLDVDITAGSSPRKLRVELPPGRFGRPKLLLKEGWVKKGVSVAFLRALDKKTVALGALILLGCAFFVGNGAYATARVRQREIGTLLCLGWSQRTIFRAILGELALIGGLAGVAGTALALLLAFLFSLSLSVLQALLVLPLATALALVAGLVPAWLAARGVPLDAVLPLRAGEPHRQRVRNLRSMALANLLRIRARTLVAVAGLLVGVGVFTVLLAINEAFQGSLVGTLLGDAILIRIRGLDFVSVALVALLGGLAVADVLYLNLRERAAEILTLRTVGWGDRELRAEVALEALGLGLLGSLAGAGLGLLVGSLVLDVGIGALALSALIAAAGGVAVAVFASLFPLSQINRLTPPTVLAEE
jgi:putative ABC transport system permease protein